MTVSWYSLDATVGKPTPVDSRVAPLVDDILEDLWVENLSKVDVNECKPLLLAERLDLVRHSQLGVCRGGEFLVCGRRHGGGCVGAVVEIVDADRGVGCRGRTR